MKKILTIAVLASVLLSGCFVTDAYNKVATGVGNAYHWVAKKIRGEEKAEGKFVTLNTKNGEVTLTVEVADTEKEREDGLMYRETLARDTGMWFAFEEEAPRVFWMKNTLIPLDVIFFNAKKEVVDYVPNMEPCKVAQCPRYPSSVSSMYALEVPAGYIQEKGIGVGDTVKE